MKKTVAALLSLIISCTVFNSCGKNTEFSPIITLSDGYTLSGGVISAEFYNKKHVDIYSDIKFSKGTARLYSDGSFTEYFEGGLLPLEDGESSYIMRVTSGNRSADYTVKLQNTMINGLSVAAKYEKVYGVGESFDKNSVTVTASLLRGGSAEIDDYGVSYRFDGEGEREVLFSCGGYKCALTVNVAGKSIPVLSDDMRDGFGAEYTIKNGEAVLSGGKNVSGFYFVPEQVESGGEKYTVTEILPYCFDSNDKLTGINIPSSVKTVGEGAFYACSALESAEFGTGTTLGGYVFCDCARLISVSLPDDIVEITDGLFSGCEMLSDFDIPEGVISIGKQAFINCASVTEAVIPAGTAKIGARAFKNCISLGRILCGIGLEKIGDGAFSYCESLQTVVIPEFADSQRGLLEGCPNVTLYSGQTSIAIYYAKKDGMKTQTVPVGSIAAAELSTEYYLGNEIGSEDLTVILYTEDYLGVAPYYGIKYDFSVPGKRRVDISCDGYSTYFEADVIYYETLSGNSDMLGAEYELDEVSMTASLSYVPENLPANTFILPTSVISNEIAYSVIGISENAVRSKTLEKLFVHDGIKYIGDGAISGCPSLSLVFCGVRTGVRLDIGENNFSGLSPELCVLCEFRNSLMQSYVRQHGIRYAGTETDRFYFNVYSDSRTSYKVGDSFAAEDFAFVFVGNGWEINIIAPEEIEFSYDFSRSNVVTAVWQGRSAELKINVTE